MAKILVMGDLAPIGMAEKAIQKGDVQWFSKGLGVVWTEADFRVANLECPLISAPSPPPKTGPALGVKTDHANALKEFSLIGLANNHVLDHGEEGLLHTMKLLEEAGIDYVGAGKDLCNAAKAHIVNINGLKIGFLAWSHREFCIATDESAGAFPIDLVKGLPILEKLSDECDFVILLYHGGPEHFPYPTPQQRKLCQFLATRGADFIFCQHSHIVGAKEVVGDSTIFYGQGNFCFDLPKKHSFAPWCYGIICTLELSESTKPTIKVTPTVHSLEDERGPAIADEATAAKINASMEQHSNILADSHAYQAVWQKWCRDQAQEYLIRQLPLGRIGRKLLKTTGLTKLLNSQSRMLWNLNRIECEAHSDAIVDGLQQLVNTATKTSVSHE